MRVKICTHFWFWLLSLVEFLTILGWISEFNKANKFEYKAVLNWGLDLEYLRVTPFLIVWTEIILHKKTDSWSHLSTAVAWREKKCKHLSLTNIFLCYVLGLLKSRTSEKINQLLLNKLNFKLFHYKARVQPVSKITTIATRSRCYM